MKNRNMENTDHNSERAPDENLDRILDAVLAKYVSTEPRPGLEARILANVRSNAVSMAQHARWYWGFAAALATILLTIAIGLRSAKPNTGNGRGTAQAQMNPSQIDLPKLNPEGGLVQPHTPIHVAKASATPIHRKPTAPKNPKLDQFPSPHPLSEQEQMLALYVAQFNDEAVIVARVRSEGMRLDREKELQEAGQSANQYPKAR